MANNALLTLLTSLADSGEACPTNYILAKRLGRGRSYASRHLAELIAAGTISTKSNGQSRIITITATNHSTAKPRRTTASPNHHRQAPPCAVCGDPVVMKSNKFPRSCEKRSCRASIRFLAYGGALDTAPWPTLGEPIETSFHNHNLTFRPDVRRNPGRPMTTSYGVSTDAYSNGGTLI